ncbi:hypothetical protein DACRYDRAFT_118858 [Dacryopinax primogenitus]|uniref:Calcium-channel protein CCH1 n=1 Tax=Dacryopinax primogenitus (strain DJM 731) TaxID=1858805 RepID=M5FNZ4_DACPD|nr:uncharacterized protein DACRYDRAFT_118858 [Dacryopinax primogenitus]EJT98090.1 hypothetical protein DACRYDRAFT_118858 [Dacryopinax primogenitus]
MSRPPSAERGSTTAYMPSSPVSAQSNALSRRLSWSLLPDSSPFGLGIAPPQEVPPNWGSPNLSPSFSSSQVPSARGRTSPKPEPLNLSLAIGSSSPRASFGHMREAMESTASLALDSPGFNAEEEEDTVHLTASIAEGDRSFTAEPGSARSTPRKSPGRMRDRHARGTSVTGQAMKAMGKSLRRVSVRVVNFGNGGEDRGVRLPDDEFGGVDQDAMTLRQSVAQRLGTRGEEVVKQRESMRGRSLEPEDGERETTPPEREEPAYDVHERLRGTTLCLFGPRNYVRRKMHDFLLWRWTEPMILVLIIANVIILTIQAVPNVYATPREAGFFGTWEDFALFGLFVVFTLEALARILVSGLILDPETPLRSLWAPFPDSSRVTEQGTLHRFRTRFKQVIDLPHRSASGRNLSRVGTNSSVGEKSGTSSSTTLNGNVYANGNTYATPAQRKVYMENPSSTALMGSLRQIETPFQAAVRRQNVLSLQSRPYLRHAWTRIDAIAVVSFWIMFGLAVSGLETGPTQHIFIFRALSVLRAARLLTITSGTTTILNSLKRAGPLLVNVAFFVLFAMILFSIIGVQSFRGNFRRSCVLIANLTDTGPLNISLPQLCGGQIDAVTLNVTSYWTADNVQRPEPPKGFICPLGSICQEGTSNPNGNSQSFDNIFAAAMQVIIVASANTWSTVMYDMMDADFFVSCLFFIVCIIVLNFWLINMFVAVITNSFAATRAETAKSAFGADVPVPVLNEEKDDGWPSVQGRKVQTNIVRRTYEFVKPGFVVAILVSLVVQAMRTANMSAEKAAFLNAGEMAFTFIFDMEIIWRLIGYFPMWRKFFSSAQNIVDLTLALVASIIQIPVIHDSRAYAWLTAFQIARAYRVILAIPRMRRLLLQVFGSAVGLANMTLFLLLTNFIGALIAVQLLRGDVPAYPDSATPMTFNEMSIAFLGMYQVTSSENWTDVLYNALSAEASFQQLVISALFICLWFLFANFIMIQMFIAVINENFSIAEEQKRAEQLSAYLQKQTEPAATSVSWMSQWNPYRFMRPAPRSLAVESLPANLVLPMQKSLVRENYGAPTAGESRTEQSINGFIGSVRKFFAMEEDREEVPLETLRGVNRESVFFGDSDELGGTERQFGDVTGSNPSAAAQEAMDARFEQRARRADFIREHPTYDKPFWIFSQSNKLRQFCQTLVFPANGERIFGRETSIFRQTIFQIVLFLTVIGGIAVAAVANPVYRREYHLEHGLFRGTWYDITEAAFVMALVTEFLIKVIADGFAFTPNAYLLSVWNIVDFVILILLIVNVLTTFIVVGGISRFTRSLKAFRALRLITLIGRIRESFQLLLFAGAMRIVDAALLAILYMIPYAIWGLNMFAGLLFSCNDIGAPGQDTCFEEYTSFPIQDGELGFLAPRVWANPKTSTSWSFDNFGSSLLILFETVSLEGWIDVLRAGMAITETGLQPQTNASEINAIYFVVYNLLGAIVILTLFVSIIISNFSNRSGSALLTTQQRQWIDLQKLIRRQRPARRPEITPSDPFRRWCFDRAVQKHGWWSRTMTVLYLLHIVGLMTQTYEDVLIYDIFQNIFFLILSIIYTVDIAVRLTGLGWKSFSGNGWNLFDIFVVAGSFSTTVPALLGSSDNVVLQLQKLFLVSIAFKLVQKNNDLNQLFKTAVASLPAIMNLFLLWLTLFIFFSILFMEVFGLTRWVSGEKHNINFSSMGNALVMLSFMSTGEGWNQFMHDYAVVYPRCNNSTPQDPDSDCGSIGWAFTLFITWNVLSMYIFVNMFTGVVVESFSYVFQMSGASPITRDEMRRFKEVWAKYDPERTGRLMRSDFISFFRGLSGIFEVKIYPSQYYVQAIMDESRANDELANARFEYIKAGLDMRKLENVLSGMDRAEIHRRRARYNRLYHEAIIVDENNARRGISFTDMLIMLAHYKLIKDETALRLEETIKRQVVLEQVTDRVNVDRVHSMLRTIILRRQYMVAREIERQRKRAEEHGIPAIVVESSPATPPLIGHRDLSDGRTLYAYEGLESPIPSPAFQHSHDTSFNISPSPSPNRHDRRVSDISMLSTDLAGTPSPRSSHVFDEAATQQVISSLNSSLWGEMMQEAEDEE